RGMPDRLVFSRRERHAPWRQIRAERGVGMHPGSARLVANAAQEASSGQVEGITRAPIGGRVIVVHEEQGIFGSITEPLQAVAGGKKTGGHIATGKVRAKVLHAEHGILGLKAS